MGELIGIKDNTPHTTGGFTCLECKHKWTGVAPLGEVSFECPNCGLFKGVHTCVIGGISGEFFKCNCGCLHFFIDKTDGPVCCYCGVQAVGWF